MSKWAIAAKWAWVPLVPMATIVGVVIAISGWDAGAPAKSAAVGVLVGAPSLSLAFYLGGRFLGRTDDLRRLGIGRVGTRREVRAGMQPLPTLLEEAKRRIFLLGINFGRSSGEIHGTLKRKAQEGCQIQVLMQHPGSELMDKISSYFARSPATGLQYQTTMVLWKAVWDSVQDKSRFQVGLHSELPTFSAVFVDEAEGQIELYAFGQEDDDRLVLSLESGPVLEEHLKRCEALWHHATKLDDAESWQAAIEAAETLVKGGVAEIQEHA